MKSTEDKNYYKTLDINNLIKELGNLNHQLDKSLNTRQKDNIKKSDIRLIKKKKARVLTIINEKRK